MTSDHMQIGEVAERTGLSLRTIRYYEEVGLVIPSDRSAGGFRLYAQADVDRLQLVKRMKPLGFSLEEMGRLLQAWDAVRRRELPAPEREPHILALRDFQQQADIRVKEARARLDVAQEFADQLRSELAAEQDRDPNVV